MTCTQHSQHHSCNLVTPEGCGAELPEILALRGAHPCLSATGS